MSEKLYLLAIKVWGVNAQMIKAIEEFAELSQRLCKRVNQLPEPDMKLYSEIADAEIMLDQLKVIFQKDAALIKGFKKHKLKKLEKSLKEAGVL